MRAYILIFFLVTPLFLFAQNRSSVGLVIAPTFASILLEDNTGSFLRFNRGLRGGLGWRIGIMASPQLTEDEFFEFGLHFAGNPDNFLNIEMPFSIRHTIKENDNFLGYIIAGVAFSTTQTSDSRLSSINYGVILGFGYEKRRKNNRGIFYQPTIRYNYRGIDGSNNRNYSYSFGLDIGLRRYG